MSEVLNIEKIAEIRANVIAEISKSSTEEEILKLRIKYLGRKGIISKFLRNVRDVPIDQRKVIGQELNILKQKLEMLFEEKLNEILNASVNPGKEISLKDVSLPGRRKTIGTLHPTSKIVREICNAFLPMGFQVVEGPEIELDRYNFELLNIPKDHPSRDMFDTFWVDWKNNNGEYPLLMRTHTSPMQARVMESSEPPIRVLVPGKVFRYEATDASHEWHFFQVEGLVVDKGITFADLKGTVYEFARTIFGSDRKIRFRCDYFPFVEPGVDVSIDCFVCEGKGCRVCGKTGWIEIMGAGMVHPKVLSSVGYDPEIYSGFAFGMGVERIAMLKYGIEDIRLFYSNDLRFLKQF